LVPIQLKGSGTPFFCMHGAMGNVLKLRDLAQRLGEDRPFYALQAQGVDGKLRPLPTIEEMAAQYSAAIRVVQPHGPYLLGGFSGGGVIAFEMAQQLRRQGEKVAIIALLDTFSPIVPRRHYTWRERTEQLLTGGVRYFASRIRWWQSTRQYRNELRLINSFMTSGGIVPLELRETHLFGAYMEAQRRYRPEVYSGRLTLFRAKEILSHNTHTGVFLGWDGLAADGIEVHEMPGGHDDFVLEPHVVTLVAELRKSLARADAAPEGSGVRVSDNHIVERELTKGAA
jgi:thioesterase domain-containing protein